MRGGAVVRAVLLFASVLLVMLGCSSSCEPRPLLAVSAGFDRPLVITRGGVYSGHWESQHSGVPAVLIRTSEPVVIENAVIRGRGHLILTEHGKDVHLTIRNVYGEALPPSVAGRYPGRFASVDTFRYVRIERSTMVGTSGINLYRSVEGATVQVVANVARNIDGRRADGQGGIDASAAPGLVQFVQINLGSALRDSYVAWNHVVNEPFESRVEDVVSLFATTGRPDDPILVHDNFIRGAYADDPTIDGYSGGGIMLGDGGGAHQRAYDNHVVATSNYGVAIAGGYDQEVRGNRVVSCGLLDDGRPVAAQNVGIYIANFSGDPNAGDMRGFGNAIAWAHPALGRNDWFVPHATVWTDNVSLVPTEAVACELHDEEERAWLDRRAEVVATLGADAAALLKGLSIEAAQGLP